MFLLRLSHLRVACAGDFVAPRATLLRGSASKSRRLPASPGAQLFWGTLGDHRVAQVEGDGLFTVHGDLGFCKDVCANYRGCTSFAYCSGTCYLKDGDVRADSPSEANDYCTTYYWSAARVATTTPTPESAAPEQVECYPLRAVLQVNQAQNYAGNPESDATGSVELLLCTNGTMQGNMSVEGGSSEIIATHIHHCEGGDSPQTKTGVLCSGPPVINFCGNNAAGLIADGTDYTAPCVSFDGSGTSHTKDMQGVLVDGKNVEMAVAERVRDIAASPGKYYFNAHTLASYTHFYPKHEGMCRGPLQGKSLAPATTTTTPPPTAAEPVVNRCYSLFSQMSMNELQKYPSNPDSGASGYVDLVLCTNGTLKATALMFGGVSEVVAMHIHRCEGGTTPQTRMADLCTGPPVVNFCGDNSVGLIADGAKYPEPCAPWSHAGSARTVDTSGTEVPSASSGSAVAQLVQDMASHPQLFYFNVHTLASYTNWYPHHNGMCRGPLQLS